MGVKLVNQIERHDNDLNNDIVMAHPDLIIENKNQKANKDAYNGQKRDHIEHANNEKEAKIKQKAAAHKDKKGEKLFAEEEETIREKKGEKLVNQIEHHDNDLNNDIGMAHPDTFDLNNESFVINETNKGKRVNQKLNKIPEIEDPLDSQKNEPIMNKVQKLKKTIDKHQVKQNNPLN